MSQQGESNKWAPSSFRDGGILVERECNVNTTTFDVEVSINISAIHDTTEYVQVIETLPECTSNIVAETAVSDYDFDDDNFEKHPDKSTLVYTGIVTPDHPIHLVYDLTLSGDKTADEVHSELYSDCLIRPCTRDQVPENVLEEFGEIDNDPFIEDSGGVAAEPSSSESQNSESGPDDIGTDEDIEFINATESADDEFSKIINSGSDSQDESEDPLDPGDPFEETGANSGFPDITGESQETETEGETEDSPADDTSTAASQSESDDEPGILSPSDNAQDNEDEEAETQQDAASPQTGSSEAGIPPSTSVFDETEEEDAEQTDEQLSPTVEDDEPMSAAAEDEEAASENSAPAEPNEPTNQETESSTDTEDESLIDAPVPPNSNHDREDAPVTTAILSEIESGNVSDTQLRQLSRHLEPHLEDSSIQHQLDSLEEEVSEISSFAAVAEEFSKRRDDIDTILETLDDIERRLTILEDTSNTHGEEISELQSDVKRLQSLFNLDEIDN